MASSSSITVGQISASIYGKTRRFQGLTWNPISRLAVSKCKNVDAMGLWAHKTRLPCDNNITKIRKSLVVYANSVPAGAPLPSGPPKSGAMSWILGLVVSFVLPFFTNKWGPLWVLKDRIENAVQTVENIVEAVEKVADQVDKISEDIADDLPEGSKLRDLVELVEKVSEKTAKTADSLDNIIDQVQECEDQVEDLVENVIKEAKSSPKAAKDQGQITISTQNISQSTSQDQLHKD